MHPTLVALRATYRHFFLYPGLMMVANIGAMVLVLPILAVAVLAAVALQGEAALTLAMAVVIGVLPSPGSAGIQLVAHEAANVRGVLWRDQLDGFRIYGLPALRIWLVSIIVTAILVGNAAFYHQSSFPGAFGLSLVCAILTLPWLAIHLYVYPLIIEQQSPRVLLVYRNAALMAVARPLYTVTMTTLWWLVLLFTTFSGLIAFIGLVLCALIQQNAAAVILPTFKRSTAPPDPA
jgi:hypothetical protein